ncbi:class I SAM-dependent methyltransferase [Sphingopyxis sp. PET50]|uniref:class I SAM-dependent methyltransferase n=1 Tax=Sphingopyxis sp. PET50 TaxID=2976533 RepID=UPI0021AEAC7F|nr:class I SAM-dependent methyltransferase [Sphingopyxis sp. PET50]
MRCLEIGPGAERLPGFETFNIASGPFTDHVGDARRLPFKDGTFAEVYSSHCIEHIEWFDVEATIAEWARVIAPGGWLEVHTVDSTSLMRAMLEWEETGETSRTAGAWKRELHKDHPFVAAAGRILCYAKRSDKGANMHRAILTPRYLRECFERAGLVDLETVAEPKGAKKHKGINMGLRGRKC